MQCATVSVPVDWKAPKGPRIKLPVVKRPATDPGRRIGTLVINFGGPGAAHADELKSGAGEFARFGKRFDLVAFDTRDTLLRCGENLVVHGDQLPIVLSNRADYDERVRFNQAFTKSCRKASGPLFDHVDAVSIAKDMEALRVFLKEPQLNFYGISYGTQIGEMYAERFPKRIRAMVLDSVVDHSLSASPFIAGAARAQEDTYRAAARWCGKEKSCPLHGRDVSAYMDRLFTAAEQGRLVDGGAPVDVSSLLKRTYLGNQTEQGWPAWFSLFDSLTVRDKPIKPLPRPKLPKDPGDAVYEGRPTALICSDWSFGPGGYNLAAALWKASRKAAPHMRGNAWYQEWSARCAGWPRPASNPQHTLSAAPTPAILLVNARHDPATSHEWATNVTSQLPGSRLLTYQGTGHGILNIGGMCVADAVTRYLTSRALPDSNAVCHGKHQP